MNSSVLFIADFILQNYDPIITAFAVLDNGADCEVVYFLVTNTIDCSGTDPHLVMRLTLEESHFWTGVKEVNLVERGQQQRVYSKFVYKCVAL